MTEKEKDPRFYCPDGRIKTGADFLRALLDAFPDRVRVGNMTEAVEWLDKDKEGA